MSDMYQTYVPSPCKGDGAKFSGDVSLIMPSYEDRLDMVIEHPDLMNVEDKKKKKSKGDKDDDKVSPEELKTVRAMVKWSYKFYHKVSIKRLSDGFVFESLDQIRRSNDTQPIIQDIATKLCQGFELGKK